MLNACDLCGRLTWLRVYRSAGLPLGGSTAAVPRRVGSYSPEYAWSPVNQSEPE